MSKKKGIKRILRNPLKSLIDTIIKKPILYVFYLLAKLIAALDLVILEKVGRWIKQGIVFCTNFLSRKIKIRLWAVLSYLLLLTVLLMNLDDFGIHQSTSKIVIERRTVTGNKTIRENKTVTVNEIVTENKIVKKIDGMKKKIISFMINNIKIISLIVFFVIMTLMFAIVSRIIGFVWTVILESSLIVSLLVLSLFGINQALSAYCETEGGISICSNIPDLLKTSFSFSNGKLKLIFPLIFTVFIPLYSYILRRKRNFIVVRNENFFGLKDDKVVFRFSIANDSKRTRIIKRVFLLVNNKVTFLIKDYEKAMLTLSPKEKSFLEMEEKYFEKEDKFYAIKGNENLTSAYLFFEMLDGYWGRNLKLTSPINKLMFSSYRVKDGFLTPAPKARFSQPLVWNEKKKK